MNNAREEERQTRLAESQRIAAENVIVVIESRMPSRVYINYLALLRLHRKEENCWRRLSTIFQAYGVLIRKSFHLVGEAGEGIVEQIDGIIELSGVLYFVEMKWYRNPVGKPEISEHLVRLMSRAEVRGIFISASDYTEPAILTAREFLQHKVVVLSTLHEIVRLLEQQDDLSEFFTKKVQAAQIHKNPYFCPHDSQAQGAL